MNERIKLLAEQAESSRLEYNSATMMTERIQEFDKQKFAELIVKECIKSIRPYDPSGHFEETIREHFYGVEE